MTFKAFLSLDSRALKRTRKTGDCKIVHMSACHTVCVLNAASSLELVIREIVTE
jgi:hypothetical protein